MDRSLARQRYADHKARAKKRGIGFEFTFDEWWAIWEPHWEKCGSARDQLGMCRTRDEGPYKGGNVRLDTPKGNAGDRVLMRRRPWRAFGARTIKAGFKSYGNNFAHPDVALEKQQEEYEWIPGE